MLRSLDRVRSVIDRVLELVAHTAVWAFPVLVAVTMLDVVTRKFGLRVPGLGSVRLQELEWHIQAVLFSAWLGFGYVRNVHVRVDAISAMFSPRLRAVIEVLGCIFFAGLYLYVVMPFSWDFFTTSLSQGESSSSPSGLGHRWIIKAVLFASFEGLLLAVVSVLIRNVLVLLDPSQNDQTHA